MLIAKHDKSHTRSAASRAAQNLSASSGCTRFLISSIGVSSEVTSKISLERVSPENTRWRESYYHHPSWAAFMASCRRALLACRACSACLRALISRGRGRPDG